MRLVGRICRVIAATALISCGAGSPGNLQVPESHSLEPLQKQVLSMPPESLPAVGAIETLALDELASNDLRYLIDPGERIVYGFACDIGGTPPRGRRAIFDLVVKERWLAIRYLLRHGSPGGRVYAAEALYVMEESGLPMPDADVGLIAKLRRSRRKLEVCEGCLHSQKMTSEVLSDSVLADVPAEWDFLRGLGWLSPVDHPDRTNNRYVSTLIGQWKSGEYSTYGLVSEELAKTFAASPRMFLSAMVDDGSYEDLDRWLKGLNGYVFTVPASHGEGDVDARLELGARTELHHLMTSAATDLAEDPDLGTAAGRIVTALEMGEPKLVSLN